MKYLCYVKSMVNQIGTKHLTQKYTQKLKLYELDVKELNVQQKNERRKMI